MNKAWTFNDGGKHCSKRKGNRDCGIRAVAIALHIPYDVSVALCKQFAHAGRMGSRSVAKGIFKQDLDALLKSHGWEWCKAPQFVGRKARAADMPAGTVIARMSHHYAAVIDGVVHDAWNSSEKMVYGYWKQKSSHTPQDNLIIN